MQRLQELMGEAGVGAILLSVGPDLPYFTGYEAMPTERLTMLVLPVVGEPILFIPQLEAPRVAVREFEMVPWGETDDPVALVAKAVSVSDRVLIGDHTWSAFLLGLQRELPDASWGLASTLTKELRMRKEAAEIEALRAAAHGVDRALARIPSELEFAGRTEADVSRDLQRMTVEEGHEVAAFAIVASGPNGASPHHVPGNRVIEPGDMVICDFGGRHDGYFSDVTRTFVVGAPGEEQVEIHSVVAAANAAGHAAVGPGVPCQEIDRAARSVIDDAGYGEFFIHRTGHGIGLETHEHPYMVEGNDRPLEPGMTFSIEPGIYVPGRLGVRIEDIAACTESGIDDLNQADRALLPVA
ncbi:MAG: M24 family metallopeptidase [Acidimicrobiia bacterium]